MDAFESIRTAASRLHDRLVADGSDPLQPVAFVQAAAKLLQLELEWVDAGNPVLKGARALLDHQSGTICCETCADPVEGALLAAHEIGHASVHPGPAACAAEDIDPSRSTEAAAVGLQRVEDYGARERRELQANVFARELLFPRARARHLHLVESQPASAMAQQSGLPVALVRQQLFDALLLPAASETKECGKPSEPARPDPAQDEAAAHRGTAFQLQAGPGTGKTRTLVKRVLGLLEEGVDPASILILTFSNRAAGELVERIAGAAPDEAPRIWVGTFHAFGLDLVRRYHEQLGLPSDPILFDRSDGIAALEELLPTLPLVHHRNLWDPTLVLCDMIGAISRAKDELVLPGRYRELAQRMREVAVDEESRTAAEKCLEVATVYELYDKTLRERGAVDFGDLILRPTLLLESDLKIRTALQLRHRHILVDEYQDVNRASARLLRAVAGDGNRLWVVGDSRQSIYRFRGASAKNMAAFASDYPGAVAKPLTVNYRSTSQVVSVLEAVALEMRDSAGMIALRLTASRGSGSLKPEIRRYSTPKDEEGGVAASIRELESLGVPLRHQAVLCRSNARLADIAVALEARGIPVLHLGSLFERGEIRDLLSVLSLVADGFGDTLPRVAAMPRYGVPLQDVLVACRHLRECGLPAPEGLAQLPTLKGLSADGVKGLERLAEDLRGLPRSTMPWEVLSTYLLDRTDLAKQLALGTSVQDRMRAVAVWQFLNFVRDQSPVGGGLPIRRTLDRVRQLALLAEERDLRQVPAAALHMEAVRLMTVHGSKGLEFEAVHIPGLTVSSFPASDRWVRCPPPAGMLDIGPEADTAPKYDSEEECLFFVALSRARTHLRLHLPQLQSSGKARTPSPFLGWLPNSLVKTVATAPVMALPPGTVPSGRVDVTIPASWPLTHQRLSAYEKCPRQFLYTHVLGLGGGGNTTAFLQTHRCLIALLKWLGTARLSGSPSIGEAEAEFERIWESRGPTDHAFAKDYRALASTLIAAVVRFGAGRRFRPAEAIALDLASGQVLVEPDELAELPDGTVVLRRVRTGKRREEEYDQLDYTLYQLAGRAKYGESTRVEAIHLTDGVLEDVSVSTKKLSNRRDKARAMLESIRLGEFPAKVNSITCPRCPHFFTCDAVAKGSLALS